MTPVYRRILVLVAVTVALVILAGLGADWVLESNKGFVLDRAERALGRKTAADHIAITFWPFGARMTNFTLADDPLFSGENIVHARELRLQLRLWPLFIGQVRPQKISLESPVITIIRDARGRHNFAGRPANERSTHKAAKDPTNSLADRRSAQFFLAPSLDIANGTLRYRDLAGGELVLTQIELKTSDFESGAPFDIELGAAVNAAQPNLHLKGRIGPIAGFRDLREVSLDGEINASDLDLGKINKALPRLRKALPRALRFDGIYSIKELKFKGTLSNLSLKGAVTGTDASFRFE